MLREIRHLLIASMPAALVGSYNLGRQIDLDSAAAGGAWQLSLITTPADASGPVGALLTGLVFWLPLLAGLLIVALGWSILFARWRDRPIDPVWISSAWLFSLMLPASVPFGFAAVALSFGLVFGCHAFGGSRRYLTNPALLAIIFLAISYPTIMTTSHWVPGSEAQSTWSLVSINATLPPEVALISVFFGNEAGPIGTTSAAACLAGAVYLVAVKLAPLRIILGGALSLLALALVADRLGLWHFAAGNFLFALVFLATDPATRPSTRGGMWAYGTLFASLTLLLRTANPDHPEGSWAALLLACLFIPLLDYVARRVGRAEVSMHGV